MNTLEALHARCQRQILDVCWWAHRRLTLSGHVAHLDPGVPAHDALRLMVEIHTKAERPAGEDHRVALATSGSTRFSRMPTLYCYLRCEDLTSPGVTERHNGHSEYATTTMMMMKDVRLVSKMEGKTNCSSTYRLSRTGIVECLKIIAVGCNLKQFDVEADRKCIFHFRP